MDVLTGRWGQRPTEDPWTTINPRFETYDWRDPLGAQKLYEKMYGGEAARLREIDPQLLAALSQRLTSEAGARQRATESSLRGSADRFAPGQYGTLSAMSDIQGQSDLSRAMSEAYLGEATRSRAYREAEQQALQQFMRQWQAMASEQEARKQQQRLANEGRDQGGGGLFGTGIGVSLSPFKIPGLPMQEGGVIDEPTLALMGEGDEREYVLPESKLLSLLSGDLPMGRDLLRARMDATARGVGTLGGGPRMGSPSSAEAPFPEAPTPFREPERPKPESMWEKIAAYMPHLYTLPGSGKGANLGVLLASLARVPGATSLGRRGSEYEATRENVRRLNELQDVGYRGEVEDVRARRKEARTKRPLPGEVYIPELDEYVKSGGAVHNRWLSERLMQHYRTPKTAKGSTKKPSTKAPARSEGLKASVGFWKGRINSARYKADLFDIRNQIASEPDSVRLAPDLQELMRVKTKQIQEEERRYLEPKSVR